MKTCIGLLVIFACPDDTPVTVSDFCQNARDEIQNLRFLSPAELAALQRPRKEAIRNLKNYYDRLCKSPSPMKNK